MRAPADDPSAEVERVLRDAARFVGALGMSMFTPIGDSASDFERSYEWSEVGPTPTERLRLAQASWLSQTLEQLDRPTLFDADAVPTEAGRVHDVLGEYDLGAVGYIPTGSADRVGFLGAGFTERPALVAAPAFRGARRSRRDPRERRGTPRGEQQRRRAEDRLHSLVEQSSETIAVLDRYGQRTYVTGEPADGDGGAVADAWGSVVIEDRKAMETAFRHRAALTGDADSRRVPPA